MTAIRILVALAGIAFATIPWFVHDVRGITCWLASGVLLLVGHRLRKMDPDP